MRVIHSYPLCFEFDQAVYEAINQIKTVYFVRTSDEVDVVQVCVIGRVCKLQIACCTPGL